MVKKGSKLSESTKKLISESVKRKFIEHPEIITNGVVEWKKFFSTKKGKQVLKKTNKKRSKTMKGVKKKPFSLEHRNNISLAVKKQYKTNFLWGRRKSSKIHLKFKNRLKKFNKNFESEGFVRCKELNRWVSVDEIDRDNKIAIFVDGEHWHAKDYKDNFIVKPSNKLAKDIRTKDLEETNYFKSKGYKVLRFWAKDIENNLEKCVQEVLKITD